MKNIKKYKKIYENIDFDSVETSEKAVNIMVSKKCLYDIYSELYTKIMKLKCKYLSKGGKVLELGSGGGFIKRIFPEVITSDIKPINNVDMVINGEKLPFEDDSLDAIIAVHVIHHIPDITKFLKEAERVLKEGGGVICVEPYWSIFARYLYKKIHPEPFDEKALSWKLDTNNPMTSSNQALSYILLKRDKKEFVKQFPNLKVVHKETFGFIRYIATGGIWLKPKFPNCFFSILKLLEFILRPIMPFVGIHHLFIWKKIIK